MSFAITDAYDILTPYFQKRVHCNEPLAQHSSFRVGGPADLWITLENQRELLDLVCLCSERQWPLQVVGAGTNILYADEGIRGIVVSLGQHAYRIEEQADETALIIADAGVRWAQILHDLVSLGWGGLEFGIGIPGTLGAGVISNVGAHNQELGQALEWIEVLDARGSVNAMADMWTPPILRRYQRNELDLGYRHSRFREQRLTRVDAQGQIILAQQALIEPTEIVVTLGLRVYRRDPQVLGTLLDKYKQHRKSAEPFQLHAGAIFKDPAETTASALLKQAGLSGKTCGQAYISEQNANYIVNRGDASAHDIATLIIEAHQQVLRQCNIHLSLNVELRGAWSDPVDLKSRGAEDAIPYAST